MDEGSPDRAGLPPKGDQSGITPVRAGLVLCGGESRRMGRDKATLRSAEGETWLERAARILAEAGAGPVLVATGTAGRLGPLRWPEVDDGPHRGAGPLAGLAAGMRASPHPLVAVLAVDLPGADADLLRWLADGWRGEPARVPVDRGGRPQPLHAVYAAGPEAADAIERHLRAGERRVLRVLDAIGAVQVEPPPHLRGRPWAENRNVE